jgi:hypothetical protein
VAGVARRRHDAREERERSPESLTVERSLTVPANNPSQPNQSPIAGSVLPIKRAEELLATLPGVISARIVAGENGAVEEIHVLTTLEVTPKQTVRNIESALIAHLGMRVDHRKISVATSVETPKPRDSGPTSVEDPTAGKDSDAASRRVIYFEDVEVRRSRSKGVSCRVTLRQGDASLIGEAEGVESERSRVDLAARAALVAIGKAEVIVGPEGGVAANAAGVPDRTLALDGVKVVEAFDREYVFVGVTARAGRETMLLSGSCEIRDSAETASVLAVLDATNRWISDNR